MNAPASVFTDRKTPSVARLVVWFTARTAECIDVTRSFRRRKHIPRIYANRSAYALEVLPSFCRSAADGSKRPRSARARHTSGRPDKIRAGSHINSASRYFFRGGDIFCEIRGRERERENSWRMLGARNTTFYARVSRINKARSRDRVNLFSISPSEIHFFSSSHRSPFVELTSFDRIRTARH